MRHSLQRLGEVHTVQRYKASQPHVHWVSPRWRQMSRSSIRSRLYISNKFRKYWIQDSARPTNHTRRISSGLRVGRDMGFEVRCRVRRASRPGTTSQAKQSQGRRHQNSAHVSRRSRMQPSRGITHMMIPGWHRPTIYGEGGATLKIRK
jgi:hypothetical protein